MALGSAAANGVIDTILAYNHNHIIHQANHWSWSTHSNNKIIWFFVLMEEIMIVQTQQFHDF